MSPEGDPCGDPSGGAPCSHVATAALVAPRSEGCEPCVKSGDGWVDVWLCLSCGWVACSDDSPNHHASEHYMETDHPVAVRLGEGPLHGWCYVHDRAF